MKPGRPYRTALVALALAAAAMLPASALAAGAEDKFTQGTTAFSESRFEDALKIFQEIWKTTKSYDVALMMARTEKAMGKQRDAAEHYSYALTNFPPTGEAEVRDELTGELTEIKKSVGIVRIRVPVKDAAVKIDGAAIDASQLGQDMFVAPGKLTIVASAPGYQEAKRTVEVKAGGTEDVTLTLQPEQTAPRSKTPAFVLGGVGLVGIVVGAALVGTAEGKKGEAQKLHDELGSPAGCTADPVKCKALRDTTASVDALGNGGVAAFVLGGLAGAAAGAYLLIPASRGSSTTKPPPAKMAVVPVAGNGVGGVVVSGEF